MIAQTILQQLGGKKFSVMTGSKNFIDGGNYLGMRLTNNKSGANRLQITLEADDTYTMEFFRLTFDREMNMKRSKQQIFKGIYADKLQEIFTDVTGLYTRL